MSDHQIYEFLDTLDWCDAHKRATVAAKRRIRFFRLKQDRMLNAQQFDDVVQRVFLKVIENPRSILRPEDLSESGFHRRIGNMINSEIFGLLDSKKAQRTKCFDPSAPMLDEAFYENIIASVLSAEEATELKRESTAILDRLADDLAQANDELSLLTWVVLDETRDGKKPREIANDNHLDIRDVYNANRRIDRALVNTHALMAR